MKTIDKVSVFNFYGLYEAFLDMKNVEDSEEVVNQFESELKANGCVWDDTHEYIIGYEIEQIFNQEAQSYIEAIRYWKECNEIEISSYCDDCGSISISWGYIYERLPEHTEYTDTYFLPEEVEKLVNGEISFSEYTTNVVNQFTIDYIKAYVLTDITNKINAMTVENLEWL